MKHHSLLLSSQQKEVETLKQSGTDRDTKVDEIKEENVKLANTLAEMKEALLKMDADIAELKEERESRSGKAVSTVVLGSK